MARIITDFASPANQAILADLPPEPKRTQGYGIVRGAANLSAVLGPASGGFTPLVPTRVSLLLA